jgi:DNA-binding PucR family transcriptional regulator
MPAYSEPFNRSFESLEALADTISEVLSCPVTIEDANHKLIAYSSHDSQSDTARTATIIGRRVPENVIQALWREGIIQQLMESDEPIRISAISKIGLGNRLAVSIRGNSEVLGYIWVLENGERLGEIAFNQLKQAAQAARTKLIQLQIKHQKAEQGFQDFFWQLLTGHLKSDSSIRLQADQLGIRLPVSFHIIVMQFETEITEKQHRQISYMITTTQRIGVIFHSVHEDQLILLLAGPAAKARTDGHTAAFHYLSEQLKDRYEVAIVREGSGSTYEDYVKAASSYQEALTVLQILTKFPGETKAVYYSELGYFRFLPLLMKEPRVDNASLQKIKAYDLIHKSDLLNTLEAFLGKDSNIKETAQALHVHMNTLTYRLKRITEIGSVDLNNMNQKVTLYLDMKMDKLRREIDL